MAFAMRVHCAYHVPNGFGYQLTIPCPNTASFDSPFVFACAHAYCWITVWAGDGLDDHQRVMGTSGGLDDWNGKEEWALIRRIHVMPAITCLFITITKSRIIK